MLRRFESMFTELQRFKKRFAGIETPGEKS